MVKATRTCRTADHWRSPRTYASSEAIQITELYKYSKSLGNPQFLLLPFQPYKLIYAFVLAEVGKISEALRYCQAILKFWKIGRAPEVDTWKNLVSSLMKRLQYEFTSSTAQWVVGGLPPPVLSTSHSNATHKHENHKGQRTRPCPPNEDNPPDSRTGDPKLLGAKCRMTPKFSNEDTH
ncbi:hypothetical protein AgCh_016673 [Apium graveolens]